MNTFQTAIWRVSDNNPNNIHKYKYPSIEEKIKRMIRDREEALAVHELARRQIAERKNNMFIPFKQGQKVWLDTRHMKTSYHKKMAPKREGPFEIEEVMGLVTY